MNAEYFINPACIRRATPDGLQRAELGLPLPRLPLRLRRQSHLGPGQQGFGGQGALANLCNLTHLSLPLAFHVARKISVAKGVRGCLSTPSHSPNRTASERLSRRRAGPSSCRKPSSRRRLADAVPPDAAWGRKTGTFTARKKNRSSAKNFRPGDPARGKFTRYRVRAPPGLEPYLFSNPPRAAPALKKNSRQR